jgi:RPA family protein
MVEEIKRQTAYKCSIDTLNKGSFVKKQGWESSYLMTEYGDFSRVNIIAVVVSKTENSVTIDDGTGQISGRLFENLEQLEDIGVGSIVMVVGRPREYNDNTYLTIELIKTVDPGWIAYRKKELSFLTQVRGLEELHPINTNKKSPEPDIVENISTMSSKDKIAHIIKQLDRGEGAIIDDVLRLSRVNNGEDLISDMMMRGEIYESKAGHVKLM